MEKKNWPKRFVVGLYPDDSVNPGTVEHDLEQVQLAIDLAAHSALNLKTDVALLYDSVKHLDSDSTISRFFDQQLINKLKKGDSVRLGSGAKMHLVVPRTKKDNLTSVVVSINPPIGLLDFLHGYKAPWEEFVVPWWRSAVEPWGDVYGYTRVVGKDVQEFAPLEIQVDSVRATIDEIISHFPGLGNLSDEKSIHKKLAKLRSRKLEIDPRSVRAHILRESYWRPEMADKLVSIAVGRGSNLRPQ